MDLNALMETDRVIRILSNGEVQGQTEGVYAPEVSVDTDNSGQILTEHESAMCESVASQGWVLESGWTGQWGYSGPLMHDSERVGGALAEHIRATPGYWCVLAVYTTDDEPAGWAVAFREAPEDGQEGE